MNSEDTTVYIVDDDAPVAHSLAGLLRSHCWPTMVFTDGAAFLHRVQRPWPACLLLDIRMAPMDGLELQCRLRLLEPELPIIFITGHGDIPMAVKAIKAGAIDFLTKPLDETKLLASLRHAAHRARSTPRLPAERAVLAQRWNTLSDRERSVVELIAAGWRQRDIAVKLHMSEATVKVHRRHAADKVQVSSLAELIAFVQRLSE